MMKLSINDDELSAILSCEFCGLELEWPFSARILWKDEADQQSYPAIEHVVTGHFWGDSNLKKFGFPACDRFQNWRDTDWQLIDATDGKTLRKGTMKMKDGWPQIA